MYSHFHGILRNTIKESYEKKSEKKIIKESFSKTQCKHVSNDNFIIFQWPWIL